MFKYDFVRVLCAAATCAILLISDYIFGIETMRRVAPYLIGAAVIFAVVMILWACLQAEAMVNTIRGRIYIVYVGLVLCAYVVLDGGGFLQHWVANDVWDWGLNAGVLVLVAVPALFLKGYAKSPLVIAALGSRSEPQRPAE